MWNNNYFIFTVIGVAVFIATSQQSLPCDSLYRLYRPDLFQHCNCPYSDWSEWEIVEGSVVNVLKSACPTGQAYTERRQKNSYLSTCPTLVETKQICESNA